MPKATSSSSPPSASLTDVHILSDLATRAPSVRQVYAHVRDGIISGKYPEGARVTEKEVSEALGLSRTPVREGLRLLVADGLLVLRANAGATVRTWTTQEIRDLYAVRILIESELAALAATRMPAETLAELRDIADDIEAHGPDTSPDNLDRIAPLNRTFHARIFESSGNPRLHAIRTSAVDIKIILLTRRSYDSNRLARTFQHNRELIDAFTAADPEWARAVMHAHLRSAQFALLELAPQPD